MDPRPSNTNLFLESSSQERKFNNCPFAYQGLSDDDSGSFPVESTEILMVSAPESPNSQTDVFHTPPEHSTLSTPRELDDRAVERERDDAEIVRVGCEDEGKVVDLGRNTNSEFLGAEVLTERIECDDENEGKEGLDSELCAERLKLVDETVGLSPEKAGISVSKSMEKIETPKNVGGGELASVERIAKSMMKLNSPLKTFGVLAGESDLKAVTGSEGGEGDGRSNVKTSVLKSNCEKNSYNDGSETQVGQNEEMAKEDLDNDGLESREACRSVEMEITVDDIDNESPARRKLRFSTEVGESDDGGTNVDNRVERTGNREEVSKANQLFKPNERKFGIKNIEDIEKSRYAIPGNLKANEKVKDLKGKRMLPASILENAGEIGNKTRHNQNAASVNEDAGEIGNKTVHNQNAASVNEDAGEIENKTHHDQNAASVNEDAGEIDENPDDDEDRWEFIKKVLKMLSRRTKSKNDPNLEHMSILEVAKMCGMTFP